MTNDYVLPMLQEYVSRYLKEPRRGLPLGYFEQRSYQRWAADEIIKSISESKFTPPVTIVENFIRKTNSFSCESSKNSVIFSIAHDVAMDILDLLIAAK